MPRDAEHLSPRDERTFKRAERLARMEEERLELGPPGLPPSAPIYDDRSSRNNKEWNGMVAPFVDKEDQIPFQLLYSLLKKKPWRFFAGFELLDIIKSDEILVWSDNVDIIICFVGQNIGTDVNLLDVLNRAGSTTRTACELRLTRVGEEVIQELDKTGLPITLCGYSIGGTSVACLSSKPEVDRGIMFNAIAPITFAPRMTPKNCTAYHIVGDSISTHFSDCIRIYLKEAWIRVNQSNRWLQSDGIQWNDVGYYHSLDRFLDLSAPYEISNAQFEQNSFENYLFFKKGDAFSVLGSIAGALSVNFNFRRKLQVLVCQNPIPGSNPSRGCKEGGPGMIDKVVGGVLGGAAGAGAALFGSGGLALGPAVVGGASAGSALASGEKGILDFIDPNLTAGAQEAAETFSGDTDFINETNKNFGQWTSQIVEGPKPLFTDGGLVQK